MRIIAGKYKRTPLKTLEGEDITRPTRDMVKEALFSTIDMHGETVFLDLFAGSGAIGLEAVSRGAGVVVFNDNNASAVKVIRQNLDKVHEEREVYSLDYQECLKRLEGRKFTHIYLDPPYSFPDYGEIFYHIGRYDVLDKKGIIICEVRKDTDLEEHYLDFECFKEKRYGINKLLYYRKEV